MLTLYIWTIATQLIIIRQGHDRAIQDKIGDLARAAERLTHLQAFDALVILKNNFAIPKLLYLLRTSGYGDNLLLKQFDDTLQTGLISILNVDSNNDQWLLASLHVGDGDLGIWCAEMLAPSAFLASAASTLLLQLSILTDIIHVYQMTSPLSLLRYWTDMTNSVSRHNKHSISRSLGCTSCNKPQKLDSF